MQYLVSLPDNSRDHFHFLANTDPKTWFSSSDPEGTKVGSGGGTAWLLYDAWKKSCSPLSFSSWLSSEKRILIHGGGQSRRLPSYAALGKLMLPIPVFRWERGQNLNQTLLDLQKPLLDKIINAAPSKSHTLLASGDALIMSHAFMDDLPEVDVICFGLCVDPALAARHGVFVSKRNSPETMEYMLQKPPTKQLRDLAKDSLFFIDVGIWLLSDKAVQILMKKSGWNILQESFNHSAPDFYDIYGTFGLALGHHPTVQDDEISGLSVCLKKIPQGKFFHFGTTPELISSSLALQNMVSDQQEIWTRNVKPHPAIFIQNALVDMPVKESHENLWIENSHIPSTWTLSGNQAVTGVPNNNWDLALPSYLCLDMQPIGDSAFVARPYGFNDSFRGELDHTETRWLNQGVVQWLKDRSLSIDILCPDQTCDIHDAPIFPVLDNLDEVETILKWMINPIHEKGRALWLNAARISAAQITSSVNLLRLEEQRRKFRKDNWLLLGEHYDRSVFFQIDLNRGAQEFAQNSIRIPDSFKLISEPLYNAQKEMFLSRVLTHRGLNGKVHRAKAFSVLQNSLLENLVTKSVHPVKNVYDDQIVWSRCPVRIDLAGGWTDTPPYNVISGGHVVNIALELNGQPPLQAFIRPSKQKKIILRSIDLGEREEISSYAELQIHSTVGSAFAIPKAALCLAGFHPDFSEQKHKNLFTQLQEFGSGIEISFLAAIPKGSGMGTSSILAATILGALSDFCSLGWDKFEICTRTLALEQLLTTGGGWQDQYGGVIPGIKLLETQRGWQQIPKIRWLPDILFTRPEYHDSMLLYYTGITRVAKNLLSEIVEGMFLNENDKMSVLKDLQQHALETWETVQLGDYYGFGKKIARSWSLNKLLDADTTNPEIEEIIARINDFSIGYKLPGAGGGGYLYIVAKDPNAARIIRKTLEDNPPNPRARFVQMEISHKGLQISRS